MFSLQIYHVGVKPERQDTSAGKTDPSGTLIKRHKSAIISFFDVMARLTKSILACFLLVTTEECDRGKDSFFAWFNLCQLL